MTTIRKLVISKGKRDRILHECHDEPTAGHLGRYKTYERAGLYYHWPSVHKDVTDYVRSCLIYQQVKAQQLAPAVLMGKRIVAKPREMVSDDTMGPFTCSPRGNQFLSIFLDAFTPWIECIPVRIKNAKTIMKVLNERIFLRF